MKVAGCDKRFLDEISGSTKLRPGLDRALDSLREGDTLIVSLARRIKFMVGFGHVIKFAVCDGHLDFSPDLMHRLTYRDMCPNQTMKPQGTPCAKYIAQSMTTRCVRLLTRAMMTMTWGDL